MHVSRHQVGKGGGDVSGIFDDEFDRGDRIEERIRAHIAAYPNATPLELTRFGVDLATAQKFLEPSKPRPTRKSVIRDHVVRAGFAVQEAKERVRWVGMPEAERVVILNLLEALDELGIAVSALTEES